MSKYVLVALLCSLLTLGCATSSKTSDGRFRIEKSFTVASETPWSKLSREYGEVWTMDGTVLQALYFLNAVEDGQPLLAVESASGWPKFRSGMLASEIMEIVVDTFTRSGYQQVQSSRLRPSPFGEEAGFRFDVEFLYPDGLEGQGLVVGAVIKERLQLIMYVGTREYFFPKYLNEVEQVIASIRLES